MSLLKHRLPNGLQVVCDQNFQTGLISVGYFVNTGSRDEPEHLSGVSHFLEHMCFKGTETRSALEINQTLDNLGANSNACTSFESTVYYATVLPDFQDQIVDLLTDMMHPALRTDDFETEKKVILEEIAMYNDQPPFGGNDQIMADWFGSHSLGRPILGTEHSVAALDPDQMRQYHAKYYSPGNIVLSIAGPVDFQRLVKQLESATANWKTAQTAKRIPVDPLLPQQANTHSHLSTEDSNQFYLLKLTHGPGQEAADRFAIRIGTTIFGDDLGSRLFWNLADPGLVDVAAAGPYEYQGCGILFTNLVCRPEDAQNVWNIYLQQRQEFLESGPTEKELELAKSKTISSICMAAEMNENRMFDLGGQYLAFGKYETPKEITEKIQNLTVQDVHVAVKKYFEGRQSIVTVGPGNCPIEFT